MKQIKTSSTDWIIRGICGGVGEQFGIPTILVRLVFIFTTPVSILVYFILANYIFDDGYI